MLDTLWRDIRFAVRVFQTRPGWTAAAIACLAIAIGANTAAFTILNGLVLRPLPFEEPDRLVVAAVRDSSQLGVRPFALREYREWSQHTESSAELLARTYFPLSLAASDGARMAQTELVSGNYFHVLRVTPLLGAVFGAEADRAGAEPVAVISHRLWQSRFASNPAAIGQTIRVNGRPARIVGVTPPSFVGAMQLIAADLWLPAVMYADLAGSAEADAVPMFGVMGRLAAGMTPEAAEARLTALMPQRSDVSRDGSASAIVVTAASGFGAPPVVQGMVVTFSAIVYLVMLLLMGIACANVAALVLARSVGRTREIAIRLSLGASKWHVARQLLVESAALAVVASVAGGILAIWLTQSLAASLSTPYQYVSYAFDLRPDMRVFAFTAGVTILAAAGCGVAPIRYATRLDVLEVFKQAAFGRSKRAFNTTVVVQFAISTALLVGTGILLRAYLSSTSTRPAFDTRGIVTATLDFDQIGVDPSRLPAMHDELLRRFSGLSGVTASALASGSPLGAGQDARIVVDGGDSKDVQASFIDVSPGYFDTLGLTVRHGRIFDGRDAPQSPVAVIDDTMARRLWPEGSALGRTFRVTGSEAAFQVIGVVSATRGENIDQPARPMFYRAIQQQASVRVTAILRAASDSRPLFDDVRHVVREINTDLAIVDLRTMDEVVTAAAQQRRAPAMTLGVIGIAGLVLSAVGLYGVAAYVVRTRVREFGIRLALGARPSAVRVLVLRDGIRLALLGLAAGLGLTWALTRLLRHQVSGIGAIDVVTLASVSAILLSVCLLAVYLPARWASRLEPSSILRAE